MTNDSQKAVTEKRCSECGGLPNAWYGQSTSFGNKLPPRKGHRRGCSK